MLALLGSTAYIASMMTHEGLGHGGYCLAAGGRNVMLTAWWETCHFPGVPSLAIKAAGPGAQLGAGLLAWLALHLLSPRAANARYFLWLYMTFNLFIASGYIAFSGITGLGDGAELTAHLHPLAAWRAGLIAFGGVAYFLSMLVAAHELKRSAGADESLSRLFRLVWIPYVSAGVIAFCTGVLTQTIGVTGLATSAPAMYRAMGHGAAMELALVSSFGAGSGMFGLPGIQHWFRARALPETDYLRWSAPWAFLAAAAITLFLVFVGPGLHGAR